MFDISYEKKMKSRTLLNCLIMLFIILVPVIALAASNHYVRAGAAGTGSGLNWTDAYTSLPATLVRGDTYFIASGNYPSYAIDDAVSGTSVITIKKATISDHGIDIGWSDSFGTGQAVFQSATASFQGAIDIYTSYVVWDGSYGSGGDKTQYGFYIAKPADNCVGLSHGYVGLGMPGVGHSSLVLSNITVRHTAIEMCGNTEPYCSDTVYSYPLSASNMTLEYCYLVGGQTNFGPAMWTNGTIAYNFIDWNWSGANCHGQNVDGDGTSNIEFYGNTIKDSVIFVMGMHSNRGKNSDWNIYNNIVIGGTVNMIWGSAIIGNTGDTDTMKRFKIHHNTHVNVTVSNSAVKIGPLTNITDSAYVYNNLFYNSGTNLVMNNVCTGCSSSAIVHDYNAYYDVTGTITTEDHIQQATGSPFISVSANNFALALPTAPGKVLGPPFDVDYVGKTRVHFDRGAFEYIGKKPSPPTNLRFQ